MHPQRPCTDASPCDGGRDARLDHPRSVPQAVAFLPGAYQGSHGYEASTAPIANQRLRTQDRAYDGAAHPLSSVPFRRFYLSHSIGVECLPAKTVLTFHWQPVGSRVGCIAVIEVRPKGSRLLHVGRLSPRLPRPR